MTVNYISFKANPKIKHIILQHSVPDFDGLPTVFLRYSNGTRNANINHKPTATFTHPLGFFVLVSDSNELISGKGLFIILTMLALTNN